jgi:hypothetical protein
LDKINKKRQNECCFFLYLNIFVLKT